MTQKLAIRLIIHLSGCVQGVGFRPFVYRLACERALVGHIRNTSTGVSIDVQGEASALENFQRDLVEKKPERALISEMRVERAPASDVRSFEIISSLSQAKTELALLPDTSICTLCLQELFDPKNRRYGYPFLHCMSCGPRFSLFVQMPFDRQNTTMIDFPMCSHCQAEYDDPSDRRFYSQTNCCPACGPKLMLLDREQNTLANPQQAIQATAKLLMQGKIIALKNTGGYLLLVDATNQASVDRLRILKQRKKKPFAVLMPSLADAKQVVLIDQTADSLLTSAAAPIVLLERPACRNPGPSGPGETSYQLGSSVLTVGESPALKAGVLPKKSPLAPSVAFESPYYGIMLAHSPLHHLLLGALKRPLVATSGNISGRPICIEEQEAFQQLKEVADGFLVHNRRIMHRLDDSIVQMISGRPMVVRRARGYTPHAVELPERYSSPKSIFGAGGHLKNSFAIAKERKIYLSQYIGDLESKESCQAYEKEMKSWEALLNTTPELGAYDQHPEYYTTRYLRERQMASAPIQHHKAHVFSGMVDNQLPTPFLSISWDGTGFGDDHTIWGGEAFIVTEDKIEHFASLFPFRLPGSEKAVKEPRRSLLGVLHTLVRSNIPPLNSFSAEEQMVLTAALDKGINAPLCSSIGRLFDAVSALLDCCFVSHFEGEAALALETLANQAQKTPPHYSISLQKHKNIWLIEWQNMIQQMLDEKAGGAKSPEMALAFHIALAQLMVQLAQRASLKNVLLTGGCMQNKRLAETAIALLQQAGFNPHWHRQIPPNDGGLAVGQIMGKLFEEKNVLSAAR